MTFTITNTIYTTNVPQQNTKMPCSVLLRVRIDSAVILQSSWRCSRARQQLREARLATMQQAWRDFLERRLQVTRAATIIQSAGRVFLARRRAARWRVWLSRPRRLKFADDRSLETVHAYNDSCLSKTADALILKILCAKTWLCVQDNPKQQRPWNVDATFAHYKPHFAALLQAIPNRRTNYRAMTNSVLALVRMWLGTNARYNSVSDTLEYHEKDLWQQEQLSKTLDQLDLDLFAVLSYNRSGGIVFASKLHDVFAGLLALVRESFDLCLAIEEKKQLQEQEQRMTRDKLLRMDDHVLPLDTRQAIPSKFVDDFLVNQEEREDKQDRLPWQFPSLPSLAFRPSVSWVLLDVSTPRPVNGVDLLPMDLRTEHYETKLPQHQRRRRVLQLGVGIFFLALLLGFSMALAGPFVRTKAVAEVPLEPFLPSVCLATTQTLQLPEQVSILAQNAQAGLPVQDAVQTRPNQLVVFKPPHQAKLPAFDLFLSKLHNEDPNRWISPLLKQLVVFQPVSTDPVALVPKILRVTALSTYLVDRHLLRKRRILSRARWNGSVALRAVEETDSGFI